MAIANAANGTCVSFCSQLKAQFGYLTRVTPVAYVVAFTCFAGGSICLPQESKAHFGLTWVRPWVNRGKWHIDENRIQCL